MNFREMSVNEVASFLKNKGEPLTAQEEKLLQTDDRQGVKALLERYLRLKGQEAAEEVRLHNMLKEERKFRLRGISCIAGVDEAGRGPLAGPVVAAAVILPPEKTIPFLNDSKQLSVGVRETLYQTICEQALAVSAAIISVDEIDRLNIFGAVMKAMREAVEKLSIVPEAVLVDGYPIKGLTSEQKAIIGGDASCRCIAAASVIAKVTRDRLMMDLHAKYPAYGFDRNKGYATADHRRALVRWGPCPEHRRSFRLDYHEIGGEEIDPAPPAGGEGGGDSSPCLS